MNFGRAFALALLSGWSWGGLEGQTMAMAAATGASSAELQEVVPTYGAGPEIVAAWHLQVESAMTVLYGRHSYVADLPESVGRLGIGHRMELRFTSSNMVYDPSQDAEERRIQFQDLSAGMKVGVSLPNHVLPQAAMLMVSGPTGGPLQTSGTYDPGASLMWEQGTKHGFTLVENVQAVRTSAGGARQTHWIPGMTVAHGITKAASLTVEYAAVAGMEAGASNIVDLNLSYFTTGMRQFDLRVGFVQDGSGFRNLLSLGYAFNLPRHGRKVE